MTPPKDLRYRPFPNAAHFTGWLGRTALVVVLGALSCQSQNPTANLEKAQESLGAGRFAEALAQAKKGLAAQPGAALRWRLQLVQLESQARAGNAAATRTLLLDLATSQAPLKPAHYIAASQQLRDAGDGKGAIEVLDAGKKRFPQDADLDRAIAQAKAGGNDDELEALRQLGYIGE